MHSAKYQFLVCVPLFVHTFRTKYIIYILGQNYCNSLFFSVPSVFLWIPWFNFLLFLQLSNIPLIFTTFSLTFHFCWLWKVILVPCYCETKMIWTWIYKCLNLWYEVHWVYSQERYISTYGVLLPVRVLSWMISKMGTLNYIPINDMISFSMYVWLHFCHLYS